MWKRFLWVRNLVFLLALSFLCSKIIQTVILSALFRNEPVLARQARPVSESYQQTNLPREKYTAISCRNIFNSEHDKREEPPATKEEPELKNMEESELNVVLLGTAVGPRQDTFAVIEDLDTHEQDLYQVGDTVHQEAQIVKVSRCQVVLKRDGAAEVLECPEPDERQRPAPKNAVRHARRRPDAGIKKVSNNKYLIDEERVESALANVNRLMTQIRVVPNFRGGKQQGWKVFAVRPRSIFAEIGLKNGDILKSVNGRDISSMTKAYEVFQDLREMSNLDLEISRKGRQQTLNYQIR